MEFSDTICFSDFPLKCRIDGYYFDTFGSFAPIHYISFRPYSQVSLIIFYYTSFLSRFNTIEKAPNSIGDKKDYSIGKKNNNLVLTLTFLILLYNY